MLIAAAIGGGVGGGLASQSHSKNPSTDGQASTAASSTTAASVPNPSIYPNRPIGYTGCPVNNSTNYTSHYGSKFQRLCNLEWSYGDDDLNSVLAGTFDLCMDQCAMWNIAYGKKSICRGAIYVFTFPTPGKRIVSSRMRRWSILRCGLIAK